MLWMKEEMQFCISSLLKGIRAQQEEEGQPSAGRRRAASAGAAVRGEGGATRRMKASAGEGIEEAHILTGEMRGAGVRRGGLRVVV
jgi:hypothetical protein